MIIVILRFASWYCYFLDSIQCKEYPRSFSGSPIHSIPQVEKGKGNGWRGVMVGLGGEAGETSIRLQSEQINGKNTSLSSFA